MSPALKSHDCHFRTISIIYQKERPAFSHGEFCDSVLYEEHISKWILSKHDQQCISTITSCWPPNALKGARPRAKNKCNLFSHPFSHSGLFFIFWPSICPFSSFVYIFFPSSFVYIIYIWTVISMTSSFVYIIYIWTVLLAWLPALFVYIYEQHHHFASPSWLFSSCQYSDSRSQHRKGIYVSPVRS